MKRFLFILKAFFGHRNIRELTYLGEIASTYLHDRAGSVLWHEEHIYFSRLIRLLPDNLRVLDVPVGTGRFVPFYELKSWKLTGVDISDDMLCVAKNYNKISSSSKFINGSITQLESNDNSFDVAVCSRFMGYIPTVTDSKKALSEIYRVTGKYLIIGLQYVSNDAEYGAEDKLGRRVKRDELLKLMGDQGFVYRDSFITGAKDNYVNEMFLFDLKKSND
jgi:2-polyprenyl-3-methyl-5-hydroxy-6-metoxy-1,4-benzoquinol methylase